MPEGRDVNFTIPCELCGYKTNVTVTIDWSGTILSGRGSTHEFRCMNCHRTFSVPNNVLKVYTNQFV